MINHVNMRIFFQTKSHMWEKWRVCFQNVEILLRMCLCLMVTHYTGERSLLRTIDVNSIIDDFARVKARKHNMWRKQLYTITLIVSEKQLDWLV